MLGTGPGHRKSVTRPASGVPIPIRQQVSKAWKLYPGLRMSAQFNLGPRWPCPGVARRRVAAPGSRFTSEAAPGEGAPRASESQRKSQRCISLALLDCLSIPGQATVPRGTCPLIGQPAVRLGKLVHPELHGLRVRKWPFPKKGTGLQDVDVANDHDEGTVGQARPSLVAALLTVALLSPSPPPPQGRGTLRR